jgi:hypothetical protein
MLQTPIASLPSTNTIATDFQRHNLSVDGQLERKSSVATFGPGASGQMESTNGVLGGGDWDSDIFFDQYSKD